MKKVGNRQHYWMYGGPNCWEKQPYRFNLVQGRPPPVLRGLIAKGWMWAERLETRKWMPRAGRWSDHREPGAVGRTGLTAEGLGVIQTIRDTLRESEPLEERV